MYVLWANGVNQSPYVTTAIVATSASLTSGWSWYGTVSLPETYNYGKIYVVDSTPYLVWADTGTGGMAMAPLNSSCLGIGSVTDFFIMGRQEAPVFFKHGSTYYMITTGYNNFDPTSMGVYFSTSSTATGPWSTQFPLYSVSGNEPAPMYVVYSPVAPTQPILVSTEYNTNNHYLDSYVFAPLIPNGTSLSLGASVTQYWSPLNYYPRNTVFHGLLGGKAEILVK
jgi:hypothetical protein